MRKSIADCNLVFELAKHFRLRKWILKVEAYPMPY